MNLESYKAAAINRAQRRIASRIKNDSLPHANILIDVMIRFTRSDEEIFIYSGHLPQETYRPLLACRAKCVHILVDDATGLDWLLKAERKPIMDIRIIERPRINHFLCTTGGFFRFEKDKEKFEAEANFNEMDTCEVLMTAFDRYKINAKRV